MIAEDCQELRELFPYFFEGTGIVLDFAVNGKEALDKATSQRFDLILIDLCLPIINGRTVVQKLRDLGNKLPILAISGSVDVTSQEDICLFDGTLLKPFALNELLEKIQHLIQKNHKTCVA